MNLVWVSITHIDSSADRPERNGMAVPSNKSNIISSVVSRASVMVIISATVAKVKPNNL